MVVCLGVVMVTGKKTIQLEGIKIVKITAFNDSYFFRLIANVECLESQFVMRYCLSQSVLVSKPLSLKG